MDKKYISKIVELMIENGIVKTDDKDIIVYGLNTGIRSIINMLVTLILGIMFNLIIESLIFAVFFPLIRTYAGGYHCKKAINCYFFSTGIIVAILILARITPQDYVVLVSVVMLLVSVPVIIKFSPVETPNKPIDENERVFFRKKTLLHLLFECILIAILMFTNKLTFAYIIVLGVFTSATLLLLGLYKK